MRIFVAGGTGAIGRPLIAELLRQGHAVTGISHGEAGAQALNDLGAAVAHVNVFDRAAVEQALRESQAEIVIDELTALPASPADIDVAFPVDRRLRLEGGGNLHSAAKGCGVRRYVQQLSGFFLAPGPGLADESVGLAVDASPGVAASAQTYADIEARLATSAAMETVGLRYGFFYGPGTWYSPDGAAAEQVRNREIPIIDQGQGVWSFIHIDDAARAAVAALTIPPGIYHIVDDDPSPVSRWLPAFAKAAGAAPPVQMSENEARQAAGPDAVYYGTRLRGASNAKAKKAFDFKPRRLEWLGA